MGLLTGKTIRASLANGLIVEFKERVVDLPFTFQNHSSSHMLRVMKLGKFKGILDMDWLVKNSTNIHCSEGIIYLKAKNSEVILIKENFGYSLVRLVKAARLATKVI